MKPAGGVNPSIELGRGLDNLIDLVNERPFLLEAEGAPRQVATQAQLPKRGQGQGRQWAMGATSIDTQSHPISLEPPDRWLIHLKIRRSAKHLNKTQLPREFHWQSPKACVVLVTGDIAFSTEVGRHTHFTDNPSGPATTHNRKLVFAHESTSIRHFSALAIRQRRSR
jgi:hypothetical protein